ncbi:uncharacterized protein LOC119662136 [Teleopsis dalmanni]|uniref:uncharacterized protein LOC119662136 n=1 Tax=Teleopsis dalmanni TaxID=139649 RepID=UPI0018CF1A6B|nr:uncharacterized protein LOC119662136 [Teleopsis dalmanni]XP_037927621.1 uncharacterized protein LOC119662136 [Teleopsis dalmanni]
MNLSKKDFIHMQRAKNVVLTGINDKPIPRLELLKWVNDLLGTKLRKVEEMCTGACYCLLLNQIFPGAVPLQKVKHPSKFVTHYINNFKVLQQSFQSLEVKTVVPIDELIIGRFQANFAFLKWFKMFYETNCEPGKLFRSVDSQERSFGQLNTKEDAEVEKDERTDEEDIMENEYKATQNKQTKVPQCTVTQKIKNVQLRNEEISMVLSASPLYDINSSGIYKSEHKEEAHKPLPVVYERKGNGDNVKETDFTLTAKKTGLVGDEELDLINGTHKTNVNTNAPHNADLMNVKKSSQLRNVEKQFINVAQQTDPITIDHTDTLNSVHTEIAKVLLQAEINNIVALSKLERLKPEILDMKTAEVIDVRRIGTDILQLFDPLHEFEKKTRNAATETEFLDNDNVPGSYQPRNLNINKNKLCNINSCGSQDPPGKDLAETQVASKVKQIQFRNSNLQTEPFQNDIDKFENHQCILTRGNSYKNTNVTEAQNAAFMTYSDNANTKTFNLQNSYGDVPVNDDFYEIKCGSEESKDKNDSNPVPPTTVVFKNNQEKLSLPFIDFSMINTIDNKKNHITMITAEADNLESQKPDTINNKQYDSRKAPVYYEDSFINGKNDLNERSVCNDHFKVKESVTLQTGRTTIMKKQKHTEPIGKNKLCTTSTNKNIATPKANDFAQFCSTDISDHRNHTIDKAAQSGNLFIENMEETLTNGKGNTKNADLFTNPCRGENVTSESKSFNRKHEDKCGRPGDLGTETSFNEKNDIKGKADQPCYYRIKNNGAILNKVITNDLEVSKCKPMKANEGNVNLTADLNHDSDTQRLPALSDCINLDKIKQLDAQADWCCELYQGIEFKRNLNYSRLHLIEKFLAENQEVDHELCKKIQSILYATENGTVLPGVIPKL